MQIEIVSATIVRKSHSADEISLETRLPDGYYPSGRPTFLTFKTVHGEAEQYLKANFRGLPFTRVDI